MRASGDWRQKYLGLSLGGGIRWTTRISKTTTNLRRSAERVGRESRQKDRERRTAVGESVERFGREIENGGPQAASRHTASTTERGVGAAWNIRRSLIANESIRQILDFMHQFRQLVVTSVVICNRFLPQFLEFDRKFMKQLTAFCKVRIAIVQTSTSGGIMEIRT